MAENQKPQATIKALGDAFVITAGFKLETIKNLKKYGTRIVYAADEFYLKSGREIPSAEYYEEYAQIENGVGMWTSFADEAEEQIDRIFSKDLRDLKAHATEIVSFGGSLDVSRQKTLKDKLYVRFMRNTITDTGDGDAVEDGEFTRVLPTINPDTINRFASKLN